MRGGLLLSTGHSHLQSTMERVGCRGNTSDMDVQPFYNFIQRTYPWHVVASFAALYALGGLPALVRPCPTVWNIRLLSGAHMLQTDTVESCDHCSDDPPMRGRLKLAFAKGFLVILVVTQNPCKFAGMGRGAAGGVGVPHHVVCQLSVTRVGQSELQHWRSVPQQLVRVCCIILVICNACVDSCVTLQRCVLLCQHGMDNCVVFCAGGWQCWHSVRDGTTTTMVSF